MIHIALGVRNDNNYIVHALVCVYSVLSNTAGQVHVHILHDETLGEGDKQCCARLSDHFGAQLSLHQVRPEQYALSAYADAHCGIGTYFRLFIPDLIPAERVIYLDCDICCLLDVTELNKLAKATAYYDLLAVADEAVCREDFFAHVGAHNIEPQAYFNAGVLVFNSGNIRKKYPDFLARLMKIIYSTENLAFSDQDALNIFFLKENSGTEKNSIFYAPPKFNFNLSIKNRHLLPPGRLAGKVAHYGYVKPWTTICPASVVYWQYRKKLFEVLQGASE